MQNINSSNLSEKAKKEEIQKIIGNITDKEATQLKEKARNIKRLENGDF